MRKLMILCVAMTALGFSASAQSVDTMNVRTADTMARPNPMIAWPIDKMRPSDTIAINGNDPEVSAPIDFQHPEAPMQRPKVEGVEIKVRY